MTDSSRGAICKRDNINSSPSVVSPNSRSPDPKRLFYKMLPKPRIIRNKPELSGVGDAVLKKLHNQHWDNFEKEISHAKVAINHHTKFLNELYVKTHKDIEGILVNLLKVMIQEFTTGDLDWTTFVGTSKVTNAMKESMEKVHEVIKNDYLVPDLAINEFHPVKTVEVI